VLKSMSAIRCIMLVPVERPYSTPIARFKAGDGRQQP